MWEPIIFGAIAGTISSIVFTVILYRVGPAGGLSFVAGIFVSTLTISIAVLIQ